MVADEEGLHLEGRREMVIRATQHYLHYRTVIHRPDVAGLKSLAEARRRLELGEVVAMKRTQGASLRRWANLCEKRSAA